MERAAMVGGGVTWLGGHPTRIIENHGDPFLTFLCGGRWIHPGGPLW